MRDTQPTGVICDLDNFVVEHAPQPEVLAAIRNYVGDIAHRISDGAGLVLFGPAGTGKDHLLVAAARVAILDFGKAVLWQNGVDLFGDFRDVIGSGNNERSLLSKLVSPDVFYLSDPIPPFGSITEFQASMLFRAIDRRYSLGKPTWVTINVASCNEAAERMGPQIVDRLTDGAVCLPCDWPCDWPSYRRPFSAATDSRASGDATNNPDRLSSEQRDARS